jgi:thiol-disulfide isomerase/thioredoxin
MQRVTDERELDKLMPGKRVIALFHATWCPYCRAFKPAFDRLAASVEGDWESIEVVLDDDGNPLWERFSIEVIPAVLFFNHGEVVQRLDAKPGVGLSEASLHSAFENAAP